jgi:hypothetical protein
MIVFKKMPMKSKWATVAAFLLAVPLFVLCFPVDRDFTLNLLLVMTGSFTGWLVGIVVSPYDTQEQAQFSVYGRVVSAFAGGYLVAKVDDLTKYVFSPAFYSVQSQLFRAILFVVSFLGTLIITFIYRRYLAAELPPVARQQDAKIKAKTNNKLWFGMTEEQASHELGGVAATSRTSTPPSEDVTMGTHVLVFRYGKLEDIN